MSKRVILGIVALVAAVGGAVAVYTVGPESMGGPQRVDVGGASFASLDTVALDRRIVTASVTGRVMGAENETDVLVRDASGFFSVRLGDDHDVRAGETLVALGRLRQPRAGGARRLDAVAWSEVERAIVPEQAGRDSVRLAPDSTALADRLAEAEDRSGEASDRSEPER